MLSPEEIKKLTTKNQTTEANTTREYTQHVFLNHLYQKKHSEKLLFKGGTALRIVYGSPRFSEDLDYTIKEITDKEIRQLIDNTIDGMREEGFEINVEYHETSGGWIIPLETKILSWPVHIELNLSQRKRKAKAEFHLISSPYVPPYSINVLAEENLVKEKIDALLSRRKPRDYYDLYFILRSNLLKKPVIRRREELLEVLDSLDDTTIKRELKVALPASHWPIIANLKNNLKKELMRL